MLSDIAGIMYSGDSLMCDLARAVVIVAWRWRPDGGACRQVSRCCITL